MVQTLSRPRVFVFALWVTSMLLSAIIGGLLLEFDAGTLLIWLFLTLLFPALVWAWLLAQRMGGSPAPPQRNTPSQSRRRRTLA